MHIAVPLILEYISGRARGPFLLVSDGYKPIFFIIPSTVTPGWVTYRRAICSTSCGSSVTFEPSYPEFGGPRDIGTSLTVTPTLQPNNYTIRLELNPSVTDLTGWSDYSYNYVIGDFASGEEYPMTLKMPEISNREVQTTIKVYDGQTVVIGGILSDTHGQLSDRWPIFADIPLVGRLFTESAAESHKDNLIISVSTRLISGDGIPVRTNTQNGLPDFRR